MLEQIASTEFITSFILEPCSNWRLLTFQPSLPARPEPIKEPSRSSEIQPMAFSLNEVKVLGYVGKEPQVNNTQSGTLVVILQ